MKKTIQENNLKFVDEESFRSDQIRCREILKQEVHNKKVLDLFAGNGSLGIYSLSDTPESVTFVEKDESILKKNLALNNLEKDPRIQIWQEDSLKFLEIAKETQSKFDVIVLNFDTTMQEKYPEFDFMGEHVRLIKDIQDSILNYGGFIFFVTNIQGFVLDRYIRPGADKLTKKTTLPEDLETPKHQCFVFYN
jgi:23S rRNA G2069 N7-methylase RlmK/C1962 C5-methylase RlmI